MNKLLILAFALMLVCAIAAKMGKHQSADSSPVSAESAADAEAATKKQWDRAMRNLTDFE